MHRMVANFSEEMQCSFSMDSIISECVVNATASNFCSIRVKKRSTIFMCFCKSNQTNESICQLDRIGCGLPSASARSVMNGLCDRA